MKGDHCIIEGHNCTVTGDHCKVKGDNCNVKGDHCIVEGRNCSVSGDFVFRKSIESDFSLLQIYDNNVISNSIIGSNNIRNSIISANNISGTNIQIYKRNKIKSENPEQDMQAYLKNIKDIETKDENNKCSICMTNEKIIVFLNCGHRQTCSSCSSEIIKYKKPCPFCKKEIVKVLRTF